MRKWVTRVLAALFCACVLFLCVMTFAPNLREFGYAVFRRYANYLPSNATVFDNISARISAFEDSLGNVFYKKEAFQQLNASMQYAIGKQMLFFGDSTMVKLKGGQLYELREDTELSETVYDLVELNAYCEAQGIPMVFVYAHTSLYGDDKDLLPVGAIDYNNEAADKALSILREGGVDVLDSREFLRDYPLEDIIFYTDFHWTPVAAREAAQQVGAWLNENGVPADESVLAADAYEKTVEEDIFFGRLGQRIGVKNIAPEDFTLLIPEFSSYIKVTHREGEEEEVHEGPFSEAVMRTEDAMRRNEEGYSTNCYYAYGPHAWESEYENDSAPQSRVLVMKDSFGSPVAAFLSNAVGELLATDQRKTTLSAEEYVEQYQPDAVVVVYCQDMLREKNYAFMDE